MAEAAQADGVELNLVTGWQDADARTAAYEARLTAYSAENSRLSAEEAADHTASLQPAASTSEQGTGYCADILSSDCTEKTAAFAETRAYEWLTAYAAEYGFILRWPEDRQSAPAWSTPPGTGGMWAWRMPAHPGVRPCAGRVPCAGTRKIINPKEKPLKRTEIAPGVHLSWDPAPKFNRCRISLHFAFPAKRETATAHALLPLVMERGYADCPDMTQMTKKLARLYGADLTVDARPLGANHNLCVSATGIKNRFALEGEDLTREYAALALGTAFHPRLFGAACLTRRPWHREADAPQIAGR